MNSLMSVGKFDWVRSNNRRSCNWFTIDQIATGEEALMREEVATMIAPIPTAALLLPDRVPERSEALASRQLPLFRRMKPSTQEVQYLEESSQYNQFDIEHPAPDEVLPELDVEEEGVVSLQSLAAMALPAVQVHPLSTVQLELHPSLLTVFPSSQ